MAVITVLDGKNGKREKGGLKMGVTSWSSIPVEIHWTWVAVAIVCGGLARMGANLLVSFLVKLKKWKPWKRKGVLVEGTVGGKYICHPRGGASEPVLMVSEKDRAKVRKTGECELMVTVTCIGGFAFAEWVKPSFFDSVELGSKVVVTYAEDMKTHTKSCLCIKKKK